MSAGHKRWVAGVELATASEPPVRKPRIWKRRPSGVDPRHPDVQPGFETCPIQRDIEFMRDRLHAPLEIDIGQNGNFYTDPTYRLAYFPVTEGELVALLVSAQVMDQYRGTPFEHDLRRAMAKVSRRTRIGAERDGDGFSR